MLLGGALVVGATACVTPGGPRKDEPRAGPKNEGPALPAPSGPTVSVIADAHSHVFNGRDIPVRGFLHHLVSGIAGKLVADLLEPVYAAATAIANAAPSGAEELEELLPLLRASAQRSAPQALKQVEGDSLAEARRLIADGLRESLRAPQPVGRTADARTKELRVKAAVRNKSLQMLSAEELLTLVLQEEDTAELRDDTAWGEMQKSTDLVGIARGIVRQIAWGLDFLKTARSSRREQAEAMVAASGAVQLFMPALVDFDRWTGTRSSDRGRTSAQTPPAEQIRVMEALSKLSIVGKVGTTGAARLHGMVAFDARREVEDDAADGTHLYDPANPAPYEDRPLEPPSGAWPERLVPTTNVRGSYQLVRWAVEHGGFVGVKLYPPVGFQATSNGALRHLQQGGVGARIDRALDRFYAYCEREEVPVIVHCGSANRFDRAFRFFGHPANWEPVLHRYPKLRLNFGHFGHLEGLEDQDAPLARSWALRAANLAKDSESVFADLGNIDIAEQEDFINLLRTLTASPYEKLRQRLMYGSDWYMNVLQGIGTQFYSKMIDTMTEHFGNVSPDFLGDFSGRNALRWLGLVNENGTRRAESKVRARLARFYEGSGSSMPDWLA
ncbi:MAG: amidohydrolase family protein [Myxococcota bacterium]|nr:amidohydrolase family protein [Myxococcota bacterium]